MRHAPLHAGRIRTFTGMMVDPLNMRPEDVNLMDIAHSLSQQCRYTGHSNTFYSVAEHSVYVMFHGSGRWLPKLLHDAPEAYLVDLAAPIKHELVVDEDEETAELRRTLSAAFRKAEERVARVVEEAFHLEEGELDAQYVHDADDAVFAMEWEALMLGKVRIDPVGPNQAKRMFLDAARDAAAQYAGAAAPEGVQAFTCERAKQGVEEVHIPDDRPYPTHYQCKACLSTFPVIGDTDQWECPGAWWRANG